MGAKKESGSYGKEVRRLIIAWSLVGTPQGIEYPCRGTRPAGLTDGCKNTSINNGLRCLLINGNQVAQPVGWEAIHRGVSL